MYRLSQRHMRKISSRAVNEDDIIYRMRAVVKKDPVIIEKFKEYGVSLDEIDTVPVTFCDLDVSAKTKNCKIYLNKNMLMKDDPFEFAVPYFLHESIHLGQQVSGIDLNKSKADDYLDKPSEEIAFEAQIDFKRRNESPESAKNYTEKLLDYHDKHGPEREEKKKELLEGKDL